MSCQDLMLKNVFIHQLFYTLIVCILILREVAIKKILEH